MTKLTLKLSLAVTAISLSLSLSGCTTYTWPDGKRKTVLGVPAQEENKRYEERQGDPIEYRIPGKIPPPQTNPEG